MSADLNTEITLRGNKVELIAMLKVLKMFETDKLEQYRQKHDCGYVEWVEVNGESGTRRLNEVSESELQEFLNSGENELFVTANGPWGAFAFPDEVELFEEIANAAPQAYFQGCISGFVTGADVECRGELKDGLLYLTNYKDYDDEHSEEGDDEEDLSELYVKAVKKKLTRVKFCKLFKVDKEEFDADYYNDFLLEACDCDFPTDMDYETFTELCDCSEIDEKEYESAITKVVELGVVDFDTFSESFADERHKEEFIYNPITKKYKELK